LWSSVSGLSCLIVRDGNFNTRFYLNIVNALLSVDINF
jgi:hypothetical protein